MNINLAIFPLLSIFILIFLSSYILAQKKSAINNAFVYILITLIFWNINKFSIAFLPDEKWLYFSRLFSFSWISMGFFVYNFLVTFTKITRYKYLYFLAFCSVVFYVLAIFTDLIIIEPDNLSGMRTITTGPLYFPLVIVHIIFPITYGLYRLRKSINFTFKELETGKKIYSLLVTGIYLAILASVILDVLLPHILDFRYFASLGSSPTTIFAIFVFLAIRKYNFLSTDIGDAISDILAGMNEGVIVFDIEGEIINYNKKVLDIFNIGDDEVSFGYLVKEFNNYSLARVYTNEQRKISNSKTVELNQNPFYYREKEIGTLLLIKDITAFIKIESELKKSHSNLELLVKQRTEDLMIAKNYAENILDTLIDGIFILNDNGIITRSNKAFCDLLKMPEDRVLNNELLSFIYRKEIEKVTHEIENLDIKVKSEFETTIIDNENNKIPVHISAVYYNFDKNSRFLFSIKDISERIKAEKKLKSSQKTYLKVISNINEAILVVENDYIKYFVNDKISDLTGLSRIELKEIRFSRIFSRRDKDIITHMFTVKTNKSKVVRVEGEGSLRWIELRLIFTKNSKNEESILAYLRDITSQKRAVEQLEENEKQFRAFIDQANDFILIKDINGRYLKVNDKFLSLINKKESEIIGKTPSELGYSEKFIAQVNEVDYQIIKNKNVIIKEKPAKKSLKLKMEWLEETSFPILDDDGQVKHIGVISRDITEKKRAARKMAKQHKELQDAYKKLQDSYDIMVNQEKLASLGTLAAGIAHEINNPAQAIKFSMESLKLNIDDFNDLVSGLTLIASEGFNSVSEVKGRLAELLSELDIDTAIEEVSVIVKENLKSVERIESIINSTYRLSFSGEEFGEVDLSAVIKDSLNLSFNRYKTVCQISCEIEDYLPEIYGAYQQLEQVMLNLILNSRDSIAEKGIPVHEGLIAIKCYTDLQKKYVHLKVADNGMGIPADIQNKIFDPFFTTKTVGKGSGLGLNIVHKILINHDAKIAINSETGKGTEFSITFPVYNENSSEE